MPVLVWVVAVGAVLGALAGSFLTLPVLWRASVDQWRRIPPGRRPRALAAGAATGIAIVVASALAIVAPWGPHTVVYVILIGFGGLMLVVLVAVAVQAALDVRRARDRQSGDS